MTQFKIANWLIQHKKQLVYVKLGLNPKETQNMDFDMKMRLIGYYNKLTDVRYVKRDVTPVPLKYKAWFVPGHEIVLWKARKTSYVKKVLHAIFKK